jgi:4-hydroxybenzoate polyprenyltransferase
MVWIAICATAMLEQSRLLLHLPVAHSWLEVFVFCGTILGYHFAHPDKLFRGLAWLMVLPSALGFWFTSLPWWVMFTPVLGWLAYYGVEKTGKVGLRSQIWAKPITVALTWSWVTVVLPLYGQTETDLYGMFLERAFFIFALALAYDLSDAEYDRSKGFGTLAMSIGHTGTFRWIGIGMAASGLMALIQPYSVPHTVAIVLSLLLGFCWLRTVLSRPSWHVWHKPMIDGVMVFWCFGVLVFWCFSVLVF